MQCRICLETDHPETMTAPCACRGTAMYIHRRCLDEHTRHYPDRMCSVCKTYMKRDFPSSEAISLLMILLLFGSMTVVSDAHPVTKLCALMSLGIIVVGFSMRNCLTEGVLVFALSLSIVCLFSTSLLSVIFLLILFAGLYTLGRYIPPPYLFVLAAVVLLSLYVAVFMASIVAHLDVYMSTTIFVTLALGWYGWLLLHPAFPLVRFAPE